MGDRKKCWAAVLGNCSPDMSSEHPVAANQFDTPTIVMSGYSWCVEPKEVGLSRAGGRILCRQHNADLSELDAAALDFKQALDWAIAKPEWDWRYKWIVDGNRLERYFFKATIGSIYRSDPTPSAGLFGADGLPTPHIVRAIYGIEPFERAEGIGMVHQVGNSFRTDQLYAIAPWIRKTETPWSGLSGSIADSDFGSGQRTLQKSKITSGSPSRDQLVARTASRLGSAKRDARS